MKCAADGCERKAQSRGYCQAHYYRWTTHGDVSAHKPIEERGSIGHAGTKGISLVMRPDWTPVVRRQLALLAERAVDGMSLREYERRRAEILGGSQ